MFKGFLVLLDSNSMVIKTCSDVYKKVYIYIILFFLAISEEFVFPFLN